MTTTRHRITGGGGVELEVVEAGDPKGRPILFVHGWSQSHLAFHGQFASRRLAGFRLVAFDLRGHGQSAAPEAPGLYQDGAHWAGDVAAILAGLKLERPVLVGWSYGGLVIGDFARRHRGVPLGGIVTVGAATTIGRVTNGYPVGDVFKAHAPALVGSDRTAELAAAVAFVAACRATPPPPEEWAAQVGWMMWTRPDVRKSMSMRTEDVRPDLAGARCPLLVVQGREDRVVVPGQGEGLAALRPDARFLAMPGVGHAPFAEAPEEFDKALALFAATEAR